MRRIEMVNAWLGTEPPGNCLPGPCRPFGVVRLGPDTDFPQPTHGYQDNAPIVRFSHTHVAGTGGASRYGNVGITPYAGRHQTAMLNPFLLAPSDRRARLGKADEAAAVGYYAVTLTPSGIRAELTCSRHVGLHRYTFPAGAEAGILLDGGAVIQTGKVTTVSRLEFWDTPARSIGGFIEIASPGEVVGRCDLRGGWGHDQPYSVFFALRADRPFTDIHLANAEGMVPGGPGVTVAGTDCRAALSFGTLRELNLQVGISFVSVADARKWLDRETGGRNFAEIRREAEDEWEALLSRFRVEGGSETERRIFHSLLTRLHCQPTDLGIDEENPGWRSGVRHFWDFYCLWDSVRNANSLLMLCAPELSRDMLNSLLDTAEHTGWLPDAWIAGHHAFQQSGCACDVLFREAQARGIPGVDYARALVLLRRNAEMLSPNPSLMGRYPAYRDLGHHPDGVPNCLSRSIEYAYFDWCLGKLAEAAGAEGAADDLRNSQRIWNLWRDDHQTFWPKDADGNWVDGFDPGTIRWDSWNEPWTYEANGRSWTMCVFHDIPGLIRRLGGPEAFVAHLDEHFAQGWFNVKETKMHIPYLYHYVGRPDRSAERVRETMDSSFADARLGLHDNEDMGCQSTYYICGSIGLYPVMGQPLWLLVPPRFDRVELDLGATGKTLRVTARRVGVGNYITAATLNGKPLARAWLHHREVADGADLAFTLGDTPNDWGRRDLPPTL
jgi:predicted alpha-1,2-mannosidase